MHTHDKFFKAFLVIYLGFLLYHASTLDLGSWLVTTGLIIGITLSIVAHIRHGYSTILLLLAHMTIEWIEYTNHGSHYSNKELVFYGLHVVLDFVFLWQEAKVHLPHFRYYIMGIVGSAVLIIIINMQYSEPVHTFGVHLVEHEHKSSILETLVIGGVLGCTLSHFFRKKRLE